MPFASHLSEWLTLQFAYWAHCVPLTEGETHISISANVHFTHTLIFIPSIAEPLHKSKNVLCTACLICLVTLSILNVSVYQVFTSLKSSIFLNILLHSEENHYASLRHLMFES